MVLVPLTLLILITVNNFKVENIKIIPGAYNVIISSKLLAEFTNSKMNLTYFIALEPDSTFG